MAVSPKEVLTKLCEKDNEAVKRAEKDIDKALREDFDGTRMIYSADLLGNMSKRARDEIIQKYRTAGWQVTYSSDQRDGDYLTFIANSGSEYSPYDR